jgi:uncharacterized membrane protein
MCTSSLPSSPTTTTTTTSTAATTTTTTTTTITYHTLHTTATTEHRTTTTHHPPPLPTTTTIIATENPTVYEDSNTPEGHDDWIDVSQRLERGVEQPRHPKVSDLDQTRVLDTRIVAHHKHIRWLEVTVQDPVRVAVH